MEDDWMIKYMGQNGFLVKFECNHNLEEEFIVYSHYTRKGENYRCSIQFEKEFN